MSHFCWQGLNSVLQYNIQVFNLWSEIEAFIKIFSAPYYGYEIMNKKKEKKEKKSVHVHITKRFHLLDLWWHCMNVFILFDVIDSFKGFLKIEKYNRVTHAQMIHVAQGRKIKILLIFLM